MNLTVNEFYKLIDLNNLARCRYWQNVRSIGTSDYNPEDYLSASEFQEYKILEEKRVK